MDLDDAVADIDLWSVESNDDAIWQAVVPASDLDESKRSAAAAMPFEIDVATGVGDCDTTGPCSEGQESEWEQSSANPYVQLCFYKDEVTTILVGDDQKPFSLRVMDTPDLDIVSLSSDGSIGATDSEGASSVSALSQGSSMDESGSGATAHFWFNTAWYQDEPEAYDETQISLLHEIASYDRQDAGTHGCGKLFRSFARLTVPQIHFTKPTHQHAAIGVWQGSFRSYVPLEVKK